MSRLLREYVWAAVVAAALVTVAAPAALAQQEPQYRIDCRFDAQRKRLDCSQTVRFTNRSNDTLPSLYFHIYPNRRSSAKEIAFLQVYAGYFKVNPFPEGYQSGGMRIHAVRSAAGPLRFAVEGGDQTILRVDLAQPLAPGASAEVELDFSVDIPHAYGRFGWHRDIFALNRWYPLLSVYNGAGWNNHPAYLYHHPYFSDAAMYTVTFTAPAKYIVAASAVETKRMTAADGAQVLTFESEAPLRDFSLAFSSRYRVASLTTAGNIRINAYYLPGDRQRAEQACSDAAGMIAYHQQRFGAYPYSQFNIAVNYLGYGGEQSSGMIFTDTRVFKLPGFLDRYFDFLIAHETGHQWFYNIIGSDEFSEMFVDEGLNSYWLLRYLEDKYGPQAQVMVLPAWLRPLIPGFTFRDSQAFRYFILARQNKDRPVIGKLSSFQEPSSIFALAYGKGAAILDMLDRLIGRKAFDAGMQRFSEEFRFKNASVDDLVRIVSEAAGSDVRWFFEQWLMTGKTCDYAVASVSSREVVVENRRQIVMPVTTRIVFSDGSQVVDEWDGQGLQHTIPLAGDKPVRAVEVDPQRSLLLDMDRTNNVWPKRLAFKPVALYWPVYELPVFLDKEAVNCVAGPSASGSRLGLASSLQKPFSDVLRLSSVYDFNAKAFDSRIGYELRSLFKKRTSLGVELFNVDSSKPGDDVRGGKLYLRRDLRPANYGLLDIGDHLSLYLIRDRRLDGSGSLGSREDVNYLRYRRKEEAIAGVTASVGFYGPYGDPDFGWKVTPTQEFAGHFLGGTEDFWRSSVELCNYRLLIPRFGHKIANRMAAGWAGPADKRLFQIGGLDGLRGYDRKTVEGSRYLLETLEYRLPLAEELGICAPGRLFCLNRLQAVGFIDIGKAWHGRWSEKDFKKDAGVGLRFHLDIAGFVEKMVVRLDAARAINESKEDTRYWLAVNQTF